MYVIYLLMFNHVTRGEFEIKFTSRNNIGITEQRCKALLTNVASDNMLYYL
jgi:hypothetical protein